MKRFALAALLAILASCATTENYTKMLDTWIGAEEIALVRKWGPPANSYTVGSSKFLVYQASRNVYMPGTAPTYSSTVVGNSVYTTPIGGTPAYTINQNCQTTFELQNDRIISYRWQGNNCRATK